VVPTLDLWEEHASWDWASIREGLPEGAFDEVVLLSEAGSTNDIARRKLDACDRVLVLAESQTEGRGQGGRRWVSPRGGLWFSLGLREEEGNLSLIPILTGVAVAEGLREMGFDARLKWPNDIVVAGGKVAGILVEAIVCGGRTDVVVGIGVNVNLCPHRLQERVVESRVGTLSALAGHPLPRGEVLSRILAAFLHLWPRWRSGRTGPVVDRWREISMTLGQRVTIRGSHGGVLAGFALDLAPDGSLVILDDEGTLRRVAEGRLAASGEELAGPDRR